MTNKISVLVIPAGSGMAITAIKALRQDKNIAVISADTNKLAPGLYLSHKGYLIPPFSDPNFNKILKNIIVKEPINVVLPALDTILLTFSEKARELEALGTKVLISTPETIRITRDKWLTYLRLKDEVPFPRTFIKKEDVDVSYPLFIKPRDGSGSKQAYIVNSNSELNFFYDYVRNPLIQEYLNGKEYTIDCLVNMNGNLIACIPRERIEVRDGISTKGLVVKNQQLEGMAKKITQKIRLKGPFFFQVKEDSEGKPKLTEINARIAGTMCTLGSSGENIHTLAVRMCLGEKISPLEIKYGAYISRYWEEIYLDEETIEAKLSKSEHLTRN